MLAKLPRANVGTVRNLVFAVGLWVIFYSLHVTRNCLLKGYQDEKQNPPFGFVDNDGRTRVATPQDLYKVALAIQKKTSAIDARNTIAQNILKEIRLQLKLSSIPFEAERVPDVSPILDLSLRPSYTSNLAYILSPLRQLPTLNDTTLTPANYIGQYHRSSQSHTKFDIVIGIPTVYRSQRGEAYLLSTIRQLSSKIAHVDRKNVLLSVLIAEIDNHKIEKIITSVRQEFQAEIDQGFLEIFNPSSNYYPNYIFDAIAKSKHFPLKDRFGDGQARQLWRTKQNLDFMFLWMQSLKIAANYYLQVEDDINVADGLKNKENYYLEILSHIEKNTDKDWLMMDFTGVGFIGKLFHQDTLASLTQYMLLFYQDKPCDWLLEQYFIDKYCSPEWTRQVCSKTLIANYRISIKPPIFKHIGKYSSLTGKIQTVGSKKSEINAENRLLGVQLFTSLHSSQGSHDLKSSNTRLNGAYKDGSPFWATKPNIGDVIYMIFKAPTRRLSTLTLTSGDAKHPQDKFPENTQVSAIHANDVPTLQNPKDAEKSIAQIRSMFAEETLHREILGTTNQGNFFLERTVLAIVGRQRPIVGLEIVIQSDSEFWVYIQDVYVQ